jgi:peptide-methionine (S)-S-oxide reductase
MKRALLPVAVGFAVLVGVAVALSVSGHEFDPPENFPVLEPVESGPPVPSADEPETATFASGCFWCSEAIFQRVKGVKSVTSGYSGGTVVNPSYDEVCTGTTGHAEAIQVTFDPKIVSYAELLEVFWRSHDPTQRNGQGHDIGPQYRSVVFYHSERQKELAERYKAKINEAGVFADPVVTEIVPFTGFYPASADHQDYYNRHSKTAYCQTVIGRKLDKLKKVFGDRLTDQ